MRKLCLTILLLLVVLSSAFASDYPLTEPYLRLFSRMHFAMTLSQDSSTIEMMVDGPKMRIRSPEGTILVTDQGTFFLDETDRQYFTMPSGYADTSMVPGGDDLRFIGKGDVTIGGKTLRYEEFVQDGTSQRYCFSGKDLKHIGYEDPTSGTYTYSAVDKLTESFSADFSIPRSYAETSMMTYFETHDTYDDPASTSDSDYSDYSADYSNYGIDYSDYSSDYSDYDLDTSPAADLSDFTIDFSQMGEFYEKLGEISEKYSAMLSEMPMDDYTAYVTKVEQMNAEIEALKAQYGVQY